MTTSQTIVSGMMVMFLMAHSQAQNRGCLLVQSLADH